LSCYTCYDKFRPGNIEKVWEYLGHLSKISPERLKYGDEKSLKGRAIFNKKARRDVLTGLVPSTSTDPDLRNTYSIIGICGIFRRSSPVRYRITDTTVDADLFSLEIESAIAHRYLQAGDVLNNSIRYDNYPMNNNEVLHLLTSKVCDAITSCKQNKCMMVYEL
jgi:hypothetical protein